MDCCLGLERRLTLLCSLQVSIPSVISEQEHEVAEALFDLARMVTHPPPPQPQPQPPPPDQRPEPRAEPKVEAKAELPKAAAPAPICSSPSQPAVLSTAAGSTSVAPAAAPAPSATASSVGTPSESPSQPTTNASPAEGLLIISLSQNTLQFSFLRLELFVLFLILLNLSNSISAPKRKRPRFKAKPDDGRGHSQLPSAASNQGLASATSAGATGVSKVEGDHSSSQVAGLEKPAPKVENVAATVSASPVSNPIAAVSSGPASGTVSSPQASVTRINSLEKKANSAVDKKAVTGSNAVSAEKKPGPVQSVEKKQVVSSTTPATPPNRDIEVTTNVSTSDAYSLTKLELAPR